MGTVSGLGLAAVAGGLAWLALKRGALEHEQRCHVSCPLDHEEVECRIVQDVRTGRWTHVRSCSSFADPTAVSCDRECVRLMNLGLRQPTVELG
jgi:hypothetical protein